jgi:oxygen-dependent protoporphyrinogen oxidase
MLPGLARQLESITYHPVALAIAEYETPVFSSRVRAFVFDEHEPVSNAGAYGLNDLHLVRYTFSGRAARHFITARCDDDVLLGLGEAALARHVPVDASRRKRFVVRRFSPGLCAYAPYHASVIDRVHEELNAVGGLYLTGDYVQGASIEACFRSASACAHQLARRETQLVPKTA